MIRGTLTQNSVEESTATLSEEETFYVNDVTCLRPDLMVKNQNGVFMVGIIVRDEDRYRDKVVRGKKHQRKS